MKNKFSNNKLIIIGGWLICVILLSFSIYTKYRFLVANDIPKVTDFVKSEIQEKKKLFINIQKNNSYSKFDQSIDELNVLIKDSLVYGNYQYVPIRSNPSPIPEIIFQTNGTFVVHQFQNGDSTLQLVSPIFLNGIVKNNNFYNRFPSKKYIHQTIYLSENKSIYTVDSAKLDNTNIYINKDENLVGSKLNLNINTYLSLFFVMCLFSYLFILCDIYLKNKPISSIWIVGCFYIIAMILLINFDSIFVLNDIGIFRKESLISFLPIRSLAQLYYLEIGVIGFFTNFLRKTYHANLHFNTFRQKIVFIPVIILFISFSNLVFLINTVDLVVNSEYHYFLLNLYPIQSAHLFYIFILLLQTNFIFLVYQITARLVSNIRQTTIIAICVFILTTIVIHFFLKDEYKIIVWNKWMISGLLVSTLFISFIPKFKTTKSAFTIGNIFWLLYFMVILVITFSLVSNYKTKKRLSNSISNKFLDFNPVLLSKIESELKNIKNDPKVIEIINSGKLVDQKEFENYINTQYFGDDLFDLSRKIYFKSQDKIQTNTQITSDDIENFDVLEKTNTIASYSILGSNETYGFIDFEKNGFEKLQVFFKFKNTQSVQENYVFKNILRENEEKDIDFAVYQNTEIVQTNSTAFGKVLPKDLKYYPQLTYQYSNNKVKGIQAKGDKVVIVELDYYNRSTIFSLFFVLFILATIIYLIQQSYFQALRTKFSFKQKILFQKLTFNYRIFISSSTLMVLIIVSISFIISNLYTKNNYKKHENNFIKNIKVMNNIFSLAPFINSDDLAKSDYLQLMHQFGYDFNIFSTKGNLLYSTNRQIYNNKIKSNYLPTSILNLVRPKGNDIVILPDAYGNYNFNSGYVLTENINNRNNFILNVLNLSYQDETNKEINIFINQIYIFIFIILIIALLFSYLITFNLNKGLTKLVKQIQLLDFKNYNQRLKWDYQDEIGQLVEEYNIMLSKLEDNIQNMADIERNLAWKEMARQIAHEIKNPLTPMKLNIQYLNKLAKTNPENLPELTQKMSAGLIEQIDLLTEISNDFSFFSKISTAEKSVVSINELLTSIKNLYSNYPHIELIFNYPPKEIEIWGNFNQIMKVYINFIKNAIESTENIERPRIMVNHNIVNNLLKVEVIDNGNGIPEDIKTNIFKPNFTTKSSGSGMGLVICHNIIEYHSGSIGFESNPNSGTKFYFTLSIYSDNKAI